MLPSKLRLTYTSNVTDNLKTPPLADFAHNWHGYIPVIHVDVKVPSEHTLCNKRYEGEYQIYYYHANRRQPIVQSIFIELHPSGREHLHFQKVINEWQAIHDLSLMECQERRRNVQEEKENIIRRMADSVGGSVHRKDSSSWDQAEDDSNKDTDQIGERNDFMDEPQGQHTIRQNMLRRARERVANPRFDFEYGGINERNNRFTRSSPTPTPYSTSPTTKQPRWSPFQPRIINSIYFYGYQGSLTEPPCSEWVAWRVLDKPMQISRDQLEQLRDILFNQVDGSTCKRTSAHWKGSVARPIQGFGSQKLYKCSNDDYLADSEKR